MDRRACPDWACIDIPALPLQYLARGRPELREHPAVVVTADEPGGIVLWVNRQARAAGILPGMRYAAGLALVDGLRAGVVTPLELAAEVQAIAAQLRTFSPDVEPAEGEPGVFWLNAHGLLGLYGSLKQWATLLRQFLGETSGLTASAAVGFGRFATYAIVRHFGGLRVSQDPAQEQKWLAQVRLDALGPTLGLPPAVREDLRLLAVRTLGEFLALPPEGLRERHGADALRLHHLATARVVARFQPERPLGPLQGQRAIEPPDDQAERLLFVARALLHGLLWQAAERREVVAALTLRLDLERGRDGELPAIEALLQPAEPCLNEVQLVDLIRLRLERQALPGPVTCLGLTLRTVPAQPGQLRLWRLSLRRDPDAAAVAIARVRAAFGEKAIVYAVLQPNHLPEAQFAWQCSPPIPRQSSPPSPLVSQVSQGQGRPVPDEPVRTLVRRLVGKPVALPSRPRHEPDGWLLANWRQGSVVRLWGPFRITGGWWVREVRRDYFYVETESKDLLWVYYDAVRRRWYQQGTVD